MHGVWYLWGILEPIYCEYWAPTKLSACCVPSEGVSVIGNHPLPHILLWYQQVGPEHLIVSPPGGKGRTWY